ncbi:Ribosomal protein S12 methylthiotransferase RimO [Planctomycetales bacterium 10988]|nr:Ribosomal protein S12 methylthiotransferase RimO [Planctomycetales bacterium 10988]
MQELPILNLQDKPAPTLAANAGECRGRYAFVSLGCPKNLVDSERMLGLLQLDGYQLVQEPTDADFVIVNTCGFIEAARQESYATIREMVELKKQEVIRGVIVSGCLPERQKEAVLEEVPEIDYLVGVFGREEVTKVADRLLGNLDEQRTVFRPAPSRPLDDTNRFRVTPKHFAYLKVSEGCNRTCSFCAIPKMRGQHYSKPMEEVLKEATQLSQDGVRELNLVAQDMTYYGMDLYRKPRLAELLQKLESVDGVEWMRLLYLYPQFFTDELIDVIAASEKVLPYLDMPLQHINDQMLKRMRRKVNRSQTEELLGKLRERIPNLVMRTTFITGFPGETDAQFEELMHFVEEQRFERLGVFTYSIEPGTPAAEMDGHLPDEVKEARREALMAVQQANAFEWNDAQVGKVLDVLIDQPVADQQGAYIGRTFADAPDIDSVVYVTGEDLKAGQIVPCEIVQPYDYDLVGVAVGEPR